MVEEGEKSSDNNLPSSSSSSSTKSATTKEDEEENEGKSSTPPPPSPSTQLTSSSSTNKSSTDSAESVNDDTVEKKTTTTKQQKPRRIIRRNKKRNSNNNNNKPLVDPILLEKTIQESNLPKAYSFEILKTVQRILNCKVDHVALQMPEGLLLYATTISDVLKRLASPTLQQVSILGDVTYGACCIDDLGARTLGAQLLVHYGHSCLVPIQHTVIPCLYVFVEITIDVVHLVDCLDLTLKSCSGGSGGNSNNKNIKPLVYLLGTIQFRHSLMEAENLLNSKGYVTSIPQAKPLSPGEVLGCTSPVLTQTNTNNTGGQNHDHQDDDDDPGGAIVCFVADGRFHLESTMISNPHIQTFYRYDPYSKQITEESYDHNAMKDIRYQVIQRAKSAQIFGILLGTLGRQGNPGILSRIKEKLQSHNKKFFIMLVSEITPTKLKLFTKIDAWVQIACPRLSVDWGHFLSEKPVLNPYELFVCLDETRWKNTYPMDFYSNDGGPWTNYHSETKQRQIVL